MIIEGTKLLEYKVRGISPIVKDRNVVAIVSKGPYETLAVMSLLKECGKIYLIDNFETRYEISKKLENLQYDYILKISNGIISLAEQNKTLIKCNISNILKKDITKKCNFAKTIFFTSGTTNTPKQVEHDWNKIIEISKNESEFLQIKTSDIITSSAPITYTYGFGCLITIPIASKCRVDLSQKIDNSTIFATTPTYIMELIRSNRLPNTRLKYLLISGEKLYTWQYNTIVKKLGAKNRGNIKLLEFLGTTETFHGVTFNPPDNPKQGSIGVPLPCYKIKIKKGDRICNIFENGKLNIKGYIGRINNKKMENKWYYTGDIVYKDNDGYIWYVSREDNIINVCGVLVSPHEIEEVILSSGLVEDCVVYGIPDPFTGEKPVAEVVMSTESKESKMLLERHIKRKLSKWKHPIIVYRRYIEYSKRGKKIRKFTEHL